MADSGVEFDKLDGNEIAIRDTVSHQQYVISTVAGTITPAACKSFPAPITEAVHLDTEIIRMAQSYGVNIRDKSGEIRERPNAKQERYAFDSGVHFIEIDAPVKTYIRVEGPFEYADNNTETRIKCEKAQLTIGARAWQCYPQETITVTESPHDLMEALSYFGDAMTTASPERAFPTLRGYPPALRVGNSLSIPSSLSKAEAGVTLTVPPELPAVLSVAPLAYYLLARVKPGEQFTLQTADGFTYTPPEDDISTAVQSLLQTCFYMDCLVRTEGLYPFNLHHRNAFDAATEREWQYEHLYEQSHQERLQSYLEADTEQLSEVMPALPLTAFVEPGSTAVEALPYLAPELGLIKPADPPRYSGDEAREKVLSAFSQNAGKSRSTSLVFDDRAKYIDVPKTESQQTLWIGAGIPLNAAAVVLDGYRNQRPITGEADSPTRLTVTVVCNEASMDKELAEVQEIIDPRDDLPFAIDAQSGVTTRELRQLIAEGTNYLHFIGHATSEGLECPDGNLDTETLQQNEVEMFFLNACQSFKQGEGLVETGSLGGVVTHGDVSNKYALEAGGLVCQLLNDGFPLGVCQEILRQTTPIGGQYTVVGNHGAILAHPKDGPPHLDYIEERGDDYRLTIETYTGGFSQYKAGSVIVHRVDPEEGYLAPSTAAFNVDRETLDDTLSAVDTPVVVDGQLQQHEAIEWS